MERESLKWVSYLQCIQPSFLSEKILFSFCMVKIKDRGSCQGKKLKIFSNCFQRHKNSIAARLLDISLAEKTHNLKNTFLSCLIVYSFHRFLFLHFLIDIRIWLGSVAIWERKQNKFPDCHVMVHLPFLFKPASEATPFVGIWPDSDLTGISFSLVKLLCKSG